MTDVEVEMNAAFERGRASRDTEVAELKGMVNEIQSARHVQREHNDLLVKNHELRQQLGATEDHLRRVEPAFEKRVAELEQQLDTCQKQVTLLRDGMDSINTTGVERAHKWAGMSARDIARSTRRHGAEAMLCEITSAGLIFGGFGVGLVFGIIVTALFTGTSPDAKIRGSTK